jgi:Beta-lactamase class C and other penicillin binding proteins
VIDLPTYYASWLDYQRWYRRVPGVQVAVRNRDDVALSAAFGAANLDDGTPLTGRHLFRVASHSKVFTTVAALQLVQQGRLRLDDTVAQHVPELAGAPVADRTLGELLAHGGGVVRDSEDGDFWQLRRPYPDRARLLDIGRAASAAVLARNEHYKYSNIGYAIAGLVLESVTDTPYPELVRKAVLEPLALDDTGPEYDPARDADFARGHSPLCIARDRRVVGHFDSRALGAATGFYSTATDLAAFVTALLPGDDRLLDADRQRLQRHHSWEIRPDARWYGLGLLIDRLSDVDVFGHTGGCHGYITCTHADPDSGWVVSVLTNAGDGPASPLAAAWYHLLQLARRADHTAADESAARFTGRFASDMHVLDVARLDGRLFALDPTADNPADDAAPLEVVDDRTLKVVGGRGGNSYGEPMRYEFDAAGRVRSMRGDSAVTMTPFAVD